MPSGKSGNTSTLRTSTSRDRKPPKDHLPPLGPQESDEVWVRHSSRLRSTRGRRRQYNDNRGEDKTGTPKYRNFYIYINDFRITLKYSLPLFNLRMDSVLVLNVPVFDPALPTRLPSPSRDSLSPSTILKTLVSPPSTRRRPLRPSDPVPPCSDLSVPRD